MRTSPPSFGLLAASLSALWLLGCADGAGPGSIDVARAAIIGGDRDEADPAVVTLFNYTADPKNASSCTGTVITPHVVLTAAHCVFPEITGPLTESFIFVGSDPRNKEQADDRKNWFLVKETRFHPGYKGATVAGHDIGVVITKDAMSVRPMRFRAEATPLAMVKDQPMVAVGYGLTDGKDNASGGYRSRKEATVTGVLGDDLFSVTKGALCHGDSGGALIWKVNGKDTLVGIHAFVSTETCTGANYATRPDVYAADYITPIAEEIDPGFLANFPPDEVDAGMDAAPPVAKSDAGATGTGTATGSASSCSMHAMVAPQGAVTGGAAASLLLLGGAFGARRRRTFAKAPRNAERP